MKDKLNKLSKSGVAYQSSFPGCESFYVGLTEQKLFKRTKEHVTRETSAIKEHLDKRETFIFDSKLDAE